MQYRANNHTMGSAPNYTGACIVMFGVNIGWMFIALLATLGLSAVMVAGLVLYYWIRWLEGRQR